MAVGGIEVGGISVAVGGTEVLVGGTEVEVAGVVGVAGSVGTVGGVFVGVTGSPGVAVFVGSPGLFVGVGEGLIFVQGVPVSVGVGEFEMLVEVIDGTGVAVTTRKIPVVLSAETAQLLLQQTGLSQIRKSRTIIARRHSPRNNFSNARMYGWLLFIVFSPKY